MTHSILNKFSRTPGCEILRRQVSLLILVSALIFCSACATARKPIPPGVIPLPPMTQPEDERLGQQTLGELTQQYPLSRDDAQRDRVERLVERLAAASGGPENTPWHVSVLEAPQVKNAAATRGNFLFVWSGLLEYLRSDDELAVILAHELGHILAGHVMPDPSEIANQTIAEVGGAVTGNIVANSARMGLAGDLAGAVAKLALEAMIVTPNQRRLETEADEIGLFLLAKAGFDPQGAINFWERVQNDPAFGAANIGFLSSHPSSSDRFQHLQSLADAAQRARLEAWVATSPKVEIYEFPSRSSDYAGEIRKGGYFFGLIEGRNWVCGPRGCLSLSAVQPLQ